jgi:hypothetical protein
VLLVKFYAFVLVSIALLGALSGYAFSALIVSVSITSSGQIVKWVNAASGSPIDIQAAVNTLGSSGGTVYIPAGTYQWHGETVTIPGGVNVFGASLAGCQGHENNWTSYTATTVLHENIPDYGMFQIDGSNGKSSRISGIQFESSAPANPTTENDLANNQGKGVGLSVFRMANFRIDHCTFINWVNIAVSATCEDASHSNTSCYGVIDHCVVDNPYKTSPTTGWLWGYGFYAVGNLNPQWGSAWNNWDPDVTHFAGVYGYKIGTTTMYVEDCHFTRCRHSTDGITGGWGVVRYNLVDNSIPPYGDADSHGSAAWVSARGFEVYNNTFLESSNDDGTYGCGDIAVRLRDGSGLVYNNTFIVTPSNAGGSKPAYFIYLDDDNAAGGNLYPSTRISQTYIWNNTYIGSLFLNNRDSYTQNTQYFLRAPSQAQDGFTYSPYVYPHPLDIGS